MTFLLLLLIKSLAWAWISLHVSIISVKCRRKRHFDFGSELNIRNVYVLLFIATKLTLVLRIRSWFFQECNMEREKMCAKYGRNSLYEYPWNYSPFVPKARFLLLSICIKDTKILHFSFRNNVHLYASERDEMKRCDITYFMADPLPKSYCNEERIT